MASEKPQITATIKFRGVTIEGMTVEELRQLRDVLNDIVGEKVVEKHIHHDHYPWRIYPDRVWYGISTGTWTVASNTINASQVGNASNRLTYGNSAQHFEISCN